MHLKKVISALLSLGLIVSSMTNSFASAQINSNIGSSDIKKHHQ